MSGLRSYDEVRAALYALVPRGIVLGLEPVRAALAAFGNPQQALPTAHIAGTNGKGSVSAMVDAGLRSLGLRVGLYTSPHLHRFAERIRVNGEPASDAEIVRSGEHVLDAMARGEIPPLTFFEATTVLAWDVFARAGVDAVVLEVGLGGRLDATNVCAPRVTAITSIGLDHQAQLGDTVDAIAREKAGILKPGVPCVVGSDAGWRRHDGAARRAIAEVAHAVGAPLIDAPACEIEAGMGAQPARCTLALASGPLEATLALSGEFQAGNAAVAAGVLEAWGAGREAVRAGLESARWPGRMERVGDYLFDAAHNPDGVEVLAAAIDAEQRRGTRVALVFGASADKDWRAMLGRLARSVPPAQRFFAAAGLKRAEDPAVLAAHAGGTACTSVGEALRAARSAVGVDGLVVACGSIFLMAEARAVVLGIDADPPVPM